MIAEKFEAMVKLGLLNSRMKDFFDIWTLSRQFAFDGRLLASAISSTFANRKTPIASQPTALTSAFADDPSKVMQWKGFLKKSNLQSAPTDLGQVIAELTDFLGPPTRALETNDSFDLHWQPPSLWN